MGVNYQSRVCCHCFDKLSNMSFDITWFDLQRSSWYWFDVDLIWCGFWYGCFDMNLIWFALFQVDIYVELELFYKLIWLWNLSCFTSLYECETWVVLQVDMIWNLGCVTSWCNCGTWVVLQVDMEMDLIWCGTWLDFQCFKLVWIWFDEETDIGLVLFKIGVHWSCSIVRAIFETMVIDTMIDTGWQGYHWEVWPILFVRDASVYH